MTLAIKSAEYVRGYKIRLTFSDNTEKTVNFEPFLKLSTNPATRKFLNPDDFKKFRIEYGDLVWNDYELCFPIIDLYENNLLKDMSFSSAA